MAGPTRRRIALAAIVLGTSAALATVAVFLITGGLGAADQVSSIIAGTVALLGLSVSAAGVLSRLAPRTAQVPARTVWGVLRTPPELPRFVADQVRAARSVPYHVAGFGPVRMAELYVQQDLEARTPAAATTRATAFALADPGSTERLEARATGQVQVRMLPLAERVEHVLDRHRHLLVEGGPGLGKSSLARSLTDRIGRQWQPVDADRVTATPVIPVLVTARALARRRDEPWTTALAGASAEHIGQHADARPTAELFTAHPAGAEWLILVDALDEVTEPHRLELLEVLAERMADASSPYRIVLLTRPLDGPARDRLRRLGAGLYSLLPFSQTALEDFVAGVFGGDTRADRFLDQLRTADLDEVAATPLLATIAVTVFASHPGRGLPGSRYELYTQYLAHLREVNTDRRRALRAKRRQRSPDAARDLEVVFDRTQDLVEHLAVTQVETNEPLLRAAGSWCERHLPSGLRMVPDRESLIADLLTTTGLLVRRDADLSFIHHTFAEHFTADGHAAALPPAFDPAGETWRHWIARATFGDTAALSVLVRWSHRGDGDRLLDWLLNGSRNDQYTACRLIGDGAAAADRHVAACLRHLELVCTYWPDEQVVRAVGRLPAGPVRSQWARARLCDDAADLSIVASAARALGADPGAAASIRSRLAGALLPDQRTTLAGALAAAAADGPGAALDELGRALRDDLATVGEVSRAARGMAALGPPLRPRVRAALIAAVHDRALVDGGAQAARVLAELDNGRREEATATIHAALDDPYTHPGDRAHFGRLLAELGTDPAGAGRLLLDLARDVYVEPFERIFAARVAADLGPEHRRSAAAVLAALAVDRQVNGWHQRDVAGTLADLGVEYHPVAATAIDSIFTGRRTANAWQFRMAAQIAVRMSPERRAGWIELLGRMPPDPPDEQAVRFATARAILDPSSPIGAAALQALAGDRFVRPSTRNTAATMLALLGPETASAGIQILEDASATDRSAQRRAYGAYVLASEFPGHQGRCEAELRRSLADPRPGPEDSMWIAFYMFETMPAARAAAAARLRRAVSIDAPDDVDRPYVLRQLTRYSRDERTRQLERWHETGADATAPVPVRSGAGEDLLNWRPADRHTAIELLAAMCRDPHVLPADRAVAAERLGLLSAGRDRAVAVLTLLCDDPHTPGETWVAANAALDRFRPGARADRVRQARAVPAEPLARTGAVAWLAKVAADGPLDAARLRAVAVASPGPAVLEAVAEVAVRLPDLEIPRFADTFRSLFDDDAPTLAAAACALAELGPEFESDAHAALVARLADGPGPADVVVLTGALTRLSARSRRAAADAAEGLLDRADADLRHLVAAVEQLGSIAATVPGALRHARRLLGDPRLRPDQAVRLAELVADLEPGDVAARDTLRRLAADPDHGRAAAFALAAAEPETFTGLGVPAAVAMLGNAVVAAALMARLDERHAPAAIAVLEGAGNGWAERWPAVNELIDVYRGRPVALRLLAGIVDDAQLTVRDRCRVAALLGTLGATGRDLAAARLVGLLEQPRLSGRTRRHIAIALAGLGPVCRDIAATYLAHSDDPIEAAAALAPLSPQYRRQAAAMLREQLDGPRRLAAAARLALVSPADRQDAALVLLEAARGRDAPGIRAAAALVRHRHPGWPEAAELLLARRGDPGYLRRAAAEALLHGGPALEGQALRLLGGMCADQAVHPHDRLEGALLLLARSADPAAAVAALADLAADGPPTVRRRAAAALPARAPERLDEAATVLRALRDDAGVPREVRANAAADLARLGPAYRGEGIAGLDPTTRAGGRHLGTLGARLRDRVGPAARVDRIHTGLEAVPGSAFA
ncbi:hypothetical protein [Dactylosporangium sp. NPDC051541]|uniref:hypothetical protein n=1 Tax=Dactylosporangium sp. NPDC051541 TaxID=3363977 RepID=UPI0037ACD09A